MGVLSDPRKTCLYVIYTRLCCGAAIDIRKMSMGEVVSSTVRKSLRVRLLIDSKNFF